MTKQNNLERKLKLQILTFAGLSRTEKEYKEIFEVMEMLKEKCDVAPASKMKSGFDLYLAGFLCINCADEFGTKTKILNFIAKEKKPLITTYLLSCFGKTKTLNYVEVYDGKGNVFPVEADLLLGESQADKLKKYISKLEESKTIGYLK